MRSKPSFALIAIFGLSLGISPGACKKSREQARAVGEHRPPPGTDTRPQVELPTHVRREVPDAGPVFGFTGTISEEEFKKLHELKTEPLPPRVGKMVTVGGNEAYLSLPRKARPPFPGVVVIQEWWGLNENIKHWADRLAAEGYAALAPDLYGGKVATKPDQAMAYMKALKKEDAQRILLEAHRYLAEDKAVQAKRRGSIGWCMGGAASLQLAIAAPDLDAAVIYYGSPILATAKLKKIRAPLLAIFGNKDKHITPAQVDKFEAALKSAGAKHRILRYDADHAFANPSQKVYDENAAKDAWEKAKAFLAEHLKR